MRKLVPITIGVLAVMAVIAAVTVVGNLLGGTNDDGTTSPEARAATSEHSSGAPSPQPEGDGRQRNQPSPTPEDDQQRRNRKNDGHKDSRNPPEWRNVIDGFAADFPRPAKNESYAQWHKKLSRWLSPDLAAAYKSTDLRSLPNTRLTGITIDSRGHEAVTAIIRYRGLTPTWVVVQPTPDGWRITQTQPYDKLA